MKKVYDFVLKHIVVIVLGLLFFTLSYNAIYQSPTADEPAHIPAGYGYAVIGDYRFNIEHPPIIKYLSGVALSVDIFDEFPKAIYEAQTENFWGYQWQMGIDYLYSSENNTSRILFLARLPIIFLTVLLGYLIYLVTKKYWGHRIGVFALVLFAFSPTILAHGNLVTTDMGITLGFFASIAAYSLYLQDKTRINLVLTIAAITFTFLSKFSAVLVLPALGLMPLYDYFVMNKPKQDKLKTLVKLYVTLAGIFVAAGLLVYFFYLFLMLRTPAMIYNQNIREVFPGNVLNLQTIFTDAPMVLRPVYYYIAGFAYVMKHTNGGHLSFFLGSLTVSGHWYYFPVMLFLKNQLVLLPMVAVGTLVAWGKKYMNTLLFGLIIFTTVYWIMTLRGSLNIGIRHILPVFPAMFILAAFSLDFLKKFKYGKYLVAIALLLYILPTVINFPDYISYASYLVRQDRKYEYFGDSSLDWGQGLHDLRTYVRSNGIENIRVDYFGGGAPVNDYVASAFPWSYKDGLPSEGYLAISATALQFSARYPEGKEYFEALYHMVPAAQIDGGSILIYKF